MKQVPYTAPQHRATAFHCPACGAFARQVWYQGHGKTEGRGIGSCAGLDYSICEHCSALTIWYRQHMIFPHTSSAPTPHPDMPSDIATDFEEARTIIGRSPRGAAALLRLCIQKLCVHLGQTDKDLNKAIGVLVQDGLNPKVQQSLDVVRVVGNESVHPGVMDLKDDEATAVRIAELVNIIVDTLISQPKAIEELYGRLPQTKRDGIDQRDS